MTYPLDSIHWMVFTKTTRLLKVMNFLPFNSLQSIIQIQSNVESRSLRLHLVKPSEHTIF